MTEVVASAPLGLSVAHRQQRRSAFERLNLALLVQAQHQCAIRWIKVKANDVAHPVDKERVAAESEALLTVWLEQNARQMRLIAVWFSSVALPIDRFDQWVAPSG